MTGKTVGGLSLYPEANRLSREQALRLYTQAGPWFSSEDGAKGALTVGQFADLAVLSDDYFKVDAEQIRGIESVLTVVDGKVVHAAAPFAELAPRPLPVSPDWSPVGVYGGYGGKGSAPPRRERERKPTAFGSGAHELWGTRGCGCWAF